MVLNSCFWLHKYLISLSILYLKSDFGQKRLFEGGVLDQGNVYSKTDGETTRKIDFPINFLQYYSRL